MIVDAEVVDGGEIEAQIERFFARHDVAYLHVHYARRGCYACRVDRAGEQ
jgi:transcriptional regulator